MSVRLLTGDHTDLARSVVASTTTGTLVAQEIRKLNPLACRPKSGRPVKMTGLGKNQTEVGFKLVELQPLVPVK